MPKRLPTVSVARCPLCRHLVRLRPRLAVKDGRGYLRGICGHTVASVAPIR